MGGSISCGGNAHAGGSACGIGMNANADDMSRVSVSKIDASISATLEAGTGANEGKKCLNVKSITGNVQQSAITWSNFRLKFSGLPISIPDSLLDSIWDRLPLENTIDGLVDEVIGTLKAELDKIDLCI